MAETKKQPTQRFVSLKVREVSLVDEAANEEEFLVIKSKTNSASPPPNTQEQQTMATNAQTTTQDAEKGKKPPVPPDGEGKDGGQMTEEGKKKQEAAAAKAERLAKLREEKAKVEKALAEEEGAATTQKDASAGTSTVETAKSASDMQMQLVRMMLDKCHSMLYNVSGVLNIDLDDETQKTVAKAKDASASIEDVRKGVELMTTAIEKAGKKQLNTERTTKLTDAIKGLMELGAEVSPEIRKALEALQSSLGTDGVKPLAPKTLAGGATAPEGTGPSSTTLTNKSAETPTVETLKALITELLKPVTEQVADVSKRLGTMETTRGAPKTLPEGGASGTTTQTTQKGNGQGFWTGVV